MKHRNTILWITVLAGSAGALAVPFIFNRIMFGSFLPPVLTQLESDSLYYLTLIKAVLHGDIWAGNPYILEYRDAMLPALVLPLWMSAIPGLLGLPINTVFLVNALLYGMLTGAVLYVLCRKLSHGNRRLSAAVAILGVASLSNLILRPVIMQTVYPVFGLFMLALLSILENPKRRIRYAALGAATAITFYLYPHLWMQTFSALGVLYLWVLCRRDWQTVRNLTMMGLGIVLVCLPQILMTVALLRDPELALLSARNGLIATHSVLPLTILNNKYTILFVAGLLLLRLRGKFSNGETLLLLLGVAILMAATSNVITGKEVDAPTHPWRPGLFVTAVGITVFAESLRQRKTTVEKLIAGFCLAALLFTTVSRTFIRMNSFSYIPKYKSVLELHELQRGYDALFAFINAEGIRDSVFLADERLSAFLPLYTENFVLFSKKAGLHVIADEELQERFLVYNADRFDAEFLRGNVEALRGVSAEHAMIYANAYPDTSLSGIAGTFLLGLIGREPGGEGERAEQIDFAGGEQFVNEMLQRHRDIERNYKMYLQKYNVRYAIEDRNAVWNPRVPDGAKEIHRDGRFTLYAL